MEQPNTQLQEVLYCLLNAKEINRRQMLLDTGILNVTARIADLRNKYDLHISCRNEDTVNKFGRVVKYGHWSLPDEEKSKAMKVYCKLQRK